MLGQLTLELSMDTNGGELMGFDRHGTKLLVGARNRSFIAVYDTSSGRLECRIDTPQVAYPWSCISPSGEIVLLTNCRGGGHLYCVGDGSLICELNVDDASNSDPYCGRRSNEFVNDQDVFFSPNGRLIATGGNPLRIWELA